MIDRLRVVDTVTMATAKDTETVGVTGDMGEKFTDFQAGLAMRAERFNGAEQGVLCHLTTGHHGTEALGQRLAGVLDEIRLGIPQVHMAWAAMHEEPQDALGSRSKMRQSWRERIGRGKGVRAQQRSERQGTNASAGLCEERTAAGAFGTLVLHGLLLAEVNTKLNAME